jgi:hypothetical protein
LLSRGYSEKEIDLMISDETCERYFAEEKATDSEPGNKALESVNVGGATGVTAEEILASVEDIGTSIAIPGLGIFIAGPMERRMMNEQRRVIHQIAMPEPRGSAALIIAVREAFGLLAVTALLAAGITALATCTGLEPSSLIFGAALGAPATLLLKRGLRNFKRRSS